MTRVCMKRHVFGLTLVVTTVLISGRTFATDFHVDNRKGSDAFDGRAAEPASETTGPTRSIHRAVQLAGPGDTVIVKNTGIPYYESLSLVGRRHSGFPALPFTIRGNGAVVDGSRPVGPKMWRRVGTDLWKLVPWRKGYFQLILKDKPVPEFRPKTRPESLPKIPAGQWMVWKGAIYYQAVKDDNPALHRFRYAYRSVGITLYEVRSVLVMDLTLKHFRLDGVNAHDRCRAVTLHNVNTTGNGRAGLAVGGLSAVVVHKCAISGNRLHSVLITEKGAVKFEESKLDKPPSGE